MVEVCEVSSVLSYGILGSRFKLLMISIILCGIFTKIKFKLKDTLFCALKLFNLENVACI